MVANESTKGILYSCSGPVFGYQTSLYQSQVYGIFSLQIFLSMMIKHYSLSIKCIGIWLCDNDSLVEIYNNNNISLENLLSDTMKENDKNYYKYQFTLTPEWNVLHQVVENKNL